jgi:hypothetical protein
MSPHSDANDGPVIHVFKPFCVSKVWRFTDPDTGYLSVADTRENLIKSIVSYRANNRLPPIENLKLVLENYLAGLPENEGETAPLQLRRGFLTTLKGGVVLLEWVLFPTELTASMEVASARAAQCVICKFNEFPNKSHFMQWCDNVAKSCVGKLRTEQHAKLGNCMMCTCVLKAKVFYNGDPKLSEEQRSLAAIVNCWQLKYYEKKDG